MNDTFNVSTITTFLRECKKRVRLAISSYTLSEKRMEDTLSSGGKGSRVSLLNFSELAQSVHILSDHLDWNRRTHTGRRPGTFYLTDTAKTSFILGQNEYGAFIARLLRGHCCLHQNWKVFLNCSCVSRSLFGCLGRGIIFRQPWR